MNYPRIALASLAAFVAYFALGGLASAIPQLREEFRKYPAVYRSIDSVKTVMPAGMATMFIAMIVLAILYAMVYTSGSGLTQGARFGALIGLFSVCTFVFHNHVNLNIGLSLTLQQAVVYFIT